MTLYTVFANGLLKFLLPFEEHQKNQVIRPQGQGNNNYAARSQISSSNSEERRTEVEGENVKWTERVKVKEGDKG